MANELMSHSRFVICSCQRYNLFIPQHWDFPISTYIVPLSGVADANAEEFNFLLQSFLLLLAIIFPIAMCFLEIINHFLHEVKWLFHLVSCSALP